MAEDKRVAIKVENLNKSFKLPHEKHSSIKGVFLNGFKKKRTYETQETLKDINFEIKKGEFFGIVGRNGSGKSTLLKCIAGVYSPTKGSIKVNGTLVPFIELGVGFNPELSGRDNVFLNGALLGFSRKQMEEMYADIVKFAELEKFMDQKLKNYSSGMQVRLAFSIAIKARGDILVLDEILAVGDAAFQEKCYSYFEELKNNNETVILVTHSMAAVKRFCSKALLIEGGRVVKIGKTEEVADQYTLDNINQGQEVQNEKNKKLTEKVKKFQVEPITGKNLDSSDSIIFKITYASNNELPVDIGFSIINNGMSVIEQNTKAETIPFGKNKECSVICKVPLKYFNPGAYHLDVALFEKQNFSLMAYHLRSYEFIIKGIDETRGGPIKGEGLWSYGKR